MTYSCWSVKQILQFRFFHAQSILPLRISVFVISSVVSLNFLNIGLNI